MRAVLLQGQMARSDIADMLGATDRTARRVTSALIESGALKSETSRAPLKLALPAKLAGRWMPGLFHYA